MNNNIIENNKNFKITIVGLILTEILFVIGKYSNNYFLVIFSYLLFFIPLFTLNIKKSLIVFFFLIPNERVFMMNNSFNFLSVYITILSVSMLIKSKFKINKKEIMTYSILTIIMLFKNLVIGTKIIDSDIIKFILITFIFSSIWSNNLIRRYNIFYLIKSMIFGTLTMGLIGIIFNLNLGYSFQQILIYRLGGVNNDPNFYAVFFSFSIALSLIIKDMEQNNFKSIVIILSLFLLGSISLSRGYLVSLVFVLLLYIMSESKKKNIIIVLASIYLLYLALQDSLIMTNLLARKTDSLDSGRLHLWQFYLNKIIENPINLLFGIGSFDKNYYIMEFGISSVPHNFILDGLYSNGIIIFNFVLFIYIQFLKKVDTNLSYTNKNLPFISAISSFIFLDGFLSTSLITFIYISFIVQSNIYKEDL